jgi:hypothetical protein
MGFFVARYVVLIFAKMPIFGFLICLSVWTVRIKFSAMSINYERIFYEQENVDDCCNSINGYYCWNCICR